MIASIPYPNIDPVFLSIGPIEVRWYGIAYVLGFVAAGYLLRSLVRRWNVDLSDEDVIDVVLVAVIGLLIGARLGYVLFYGNGSYWEDPLSVFRVWDGGMSFHGGLIGILVAGAWVARRKGVSPLTVFDLGAVGAPIGLFLGRVANFVNGELWGRETDVPWAMVFPNAPTAYPRHPSQLYEALLEGLVLFLVLFVLSRRRRPTGVVLGVFLTLYGAFRFFVEFFREPDIQLGFLVGGTTMGQLLSIPMFLVGLWLLYRACSAIVKNDDADGDARRVTEG